MTQAQPLIVAQDIELGRRCALGDEVAIRAVTAANNQRLFRAAWSILKDRSEAEDAVQSAYMKAFASVHLFEGRSTLSTWLTRIAINEALSLFRSRERRRSMLETGGVAMLNDYRKVAAPDEPLGREQLRAMIERAVGALPDSFRTVFVLRDIEGLSVEETADALDLPPSTVKTRLHRARRKLQRCLAPDVQDALVGTFPFAGADCERMTAKVIDAKSGLQLESAESRSHPDLLGHLQTEECETGHTLCVGDDGTPLTIIELQYLLEQGSAARHRAYPGARRLALATGEPVRQIDNETFEVIETGEIVRRVT